MASPPAAAAGNPGDEERSGVAGEDVSSSTGGTGDSVAAAGGGELSHYQKFERIDGPNKVRFTAEKGSMHTKFTSTYQTPAAKIIVLPFIYQSFVWLGKFFALVYTL